MSGPDIQQIIDKYGAPVYEAALRQVYVNTVLDTMGLVTLLVLLGIAFGVVLPRGLKVYRAKKAEGGYTDTFGYEIGGVFGLILAAIAVVSICVLVTELTTYLLNPTWAAVEIILKAVGK